MIGLKKARICAWGQFCSLCGFGLEMILSYSYVISDFLRLCRVLAVISEIVVSEEASAGIPIPIRYIHQELNIRVDT